MYSKKTIGKHSRIQLRMNAFQWFNVVPMLGHLFIHNENKENDAISWTWETRHKLGAASANIMLAWAKTYARTYR
jgi:hypothetical protein